MRYLSADYIRSTEQAQKMLTQLEEDYEFCKDSVMYIGLDTETRPMDGHPIEDALRWWGKDPGEPFLFIVGWSTKLGGIPCRFYAIPEEFTWAFSRVVEFANYHSAGEKPIEWVMFNRTFDLGMVEYSAGIRIIGKTHEVFTVLRTACFMPDWWKDMSLKGISEKFLDPKAAEPQERLNVWKAHYENHRQKVLTQRLKDAKFSKKAMAHYQLQKMPLPFHVEQVILEWRTEFPDFTFAIVPEEVLIPYAINDVYLTLWLFVVGMKLILERGTMDIYEREQVLYRYNIRQQSVDGWKVNREELEKAHKIGEKKIEELTEYLRVNLDFDGCPTISQDVKKKGFNPDSLDQIKKMFAHKGLSLPDLQAFTMLQWVEKDGVRTQWAELIEKYQDFKLTTKLHGTYVSVLLNTSAADGKCHPSIRQDRAYTGRQAMSNPPLQTIPRKEIPEYNVRQFFEADSSDYRLWLFDYSGMEVTVFAEYCRDPIMLDALAKGADFHSMLSLKAFKPARDIVAKAMLYLFEKGEMSHSDYLFHVEQVRDRHVVDHQLLKRLKKFMEENMEKDYKKYDKYRQAAKVGMFAILYGAGGTALSEQMTEESGLPISVEEALAFKAAFYALYPRAWKFTEKVSEFVSMRHALHTIYNHGRAYGWLRNMYGRLYLMEVRDAYKGVNFLVQGSCADLLKKKIIKIAQLLEEGSYKSRIILSIHDELAFNLHKSEERELVPIIQQIMEDNPEFEVVQLKAEASFCAGSWVTKTKFTDWKQLDKVA